MTKINNVSDVFREAKKYLWDGEGSYCSAGDEFICHAIDYTDVWESLYSCVLTEQAKEIVQQRLGENRYGARTVTDYLQDVLKLDYEELTPVKVQKYRKDWLTALEKEFAPKLKPKKGFAIHHIDGDKNNNELSNLTYVKFK